MPIVLTVINPFDGFRRGDQITDARVVKELLVSEHRIDVVKVSKPDDPAPKAKPAAD